MSRYLLVIALACIIYIPLKAQKPVALKAFTLFTGKSPKTFSLFNPGADAKDDILQYVREASTFTIRPEVLQEIQEADPGILRLALPEPSGILLDLYRVSVFSKEARIKTSDRRSYLPDSNTQFYRGFIHGNLNSIAIVTIFENDVHVVFSDQSGNMRIQKTNDNNYIIFKDDDIKIPKNIECYTPDTGTPISLDDQKEIDPRQMTGNCVQVYVECDHQSYLDNGSSVPNTEAWVSALWNEVETLYANESIPVEVSDVFIYTAWDPYIGFNNTGDILTAFSAHIDTLSYDGRLAHFLTTRTLGGGIAYLDVLCSEQYQCAVSANLSTTIVHFPTYSWTVEVVTHEMGHNLGSYHTHACVWNGNNTQIDDCGNVWAVNTGNPVEGAQCFNPNNPILPGSGGGTIMSYCHLISGVGIGFNNGFGTLPGNVIRNRYNNATCNTGTCSPPDCTTLIDPAPGAINVDINADLTWASSLGATGYRLTIGTSPTNGSIMNNTDVGLVTTYNPLPLFPWNTLLYVKIVPYNNLGDAIGCSNQTFTTEQNVAPQCTHITQPVNGATQVNVNTIIKWAPSVGNQSGYYLSIGTTLNGTDIVNHVNVGNVTSYDHPSAFPYATTLYVKINPYWANGEITNCTSQSFTTWVPINGDFCSTAIDLPCGSALSGSTTLAIEDTGIPTCNLALGAPGVWYKFVGNGQNTIIHTCSQYNFDTQLHVYSGTCNSLVCIGAIDDFCVQGSQLSFPTTNGTTYYILVDGYGGAVGSFTITRTCYSGPFYCTSYGLFGTYEWIKKMTLGTYVKDSGAGSYTDFTTDTIAISRGGSYEVTLTPGFLQFPRDEYFALWIDYNKDGDFTDAGELQFNIGPVTSMYTTTISVPITTNTGSTRMRISMKNAPITSSCEAFVYGEVEDYSVKIKCNLVTSTTESGNGSLRSVSFCVADGDPVLFSPTLNNQVITLTSGALTSDGIWKWFADANSNITIKAAGATTNRILNIPVGKSAEIQNLKFLGGNATIANVIDNLGTLILRNCELRPPTGSTVSPLRNASGGQTTIIGTTMIKY